MTRTCPTAEEMDAALEAFHRGCPGEFDRLLGDDDSGGPGVCGMLYEWKRRMMKEDAKSRLIITKERCESMPW